MKTGIKTVPLIIGVLIFAWFPITGCSLSAQAGVEGSGPSITYQTFYDDLSPYGSWIDYPGYGHVWSPSLEAGFRPYATNGHWAYSSQGWAWVSGYNWGWAPFHYGRWLYDDMYGWLWVPGYEWSPAWVTWGAVDNFYCWAPLTPKVSVNVSYNSWRPHSYYWNYVNKNNIYRTNLNTYIEQPRHVENIHNQITIINNYNTTNIHKNYYSTGPDVKEVERYTKEKITPVSIKTVNNITEVKNITNINNSHIENNTTKVENINSSVTDSHNTRIENNTNNNIRNTNTNISNTNIKNEKGETHPTAPISKAKSSTQATSKHKAPEVYFFKPKVEAPATTKAAQQAPQPREYRKVEGNNIRPVLEATEKPPTRTHNEQVENLRNLPPVVKPVQNFNNQRERPKAEKPERR